jgi:probable rRNA maturation factor
MQVNIFNPSHCAGVNRRKMRALVRKVTVAEKQHLSILNIIVTDDTYLRTLNRTYFGKNRTTNVISFNMGTVSEIYVSCNRVETEADLLYFVIHGLLHIIGYDHRTRTQQKAMETRCLTYLDYA